MPFPAHAKLYCMTTPATYHSLRFRLRIALGLNAIIIAAEFIGGWWLNSIGLISDAGHNLIDQGSLFLALYAHLLTARPASEERTFGYHRAGIIAAFLNSFILLLTAFGIALISFKRLLNPVPIDGGWVMAVAAVSFLANLSIALLLQHGAKDDLNIRSAFWHMLGDAWVSLGVVVSGGAIMLTGLTILDPLVSLLVVVVILHGAWPLFKESLEVLLESTPPGVSTAHIAATIESIPGVKNVHDLHIWAVEPRLIMLTCHVLVDGDDDVLTDTLLRAIRTRITSDFGIQHMTIQMGTSCCHAETAHCDLSKLVDQHQDIQRMHVQR
jgi:cobalt-zinc-cadmium efflux system protein